MVSFSPDLLIVVEQSLRASGMARFKVTSNSMLPFIRKDDWIEVKIVRQNDSLRNGDIILYRRQNDFLLHRIIKMNADLIWTKGDRNRTIDPYVDRTSVLAKLTKIQKKKILINFENPVINFIQRCFGKIFSFLMR